MKNMKFLIKDADQSKRLQEVLFSLGHHWHRGKVVQYTDRVAIFTYEHTAALSGCGSDFYHEEVQHTATDTENFIAEHSSVRAVEPEAPLSVNAVGILTEAAKIIGSRAVERDKGDSERSMYSCVQAFNALTKHSLTEEQGWSFMVILKMARAQGGVFKLDDYLDGAAYFALAGEAAAKV